MLVRSALPFSIILLFACLLLAPDKIQAVNQVKLHPIATLFTLETLPRWWELDLLLSGVFVCTSRHFFARNFASGFLHLDGQCNTLKCNI